VIRFAAARAGPLFAESRGHRRLRRSTDENSADGPRKSLKGYYEEVRRSTDGSAAANWTRARIEFSRDKTTAEQEAFPAALSNPP